MVSTGRAEIAVALATPFLLFGYPRHGWKIYDMTLIGQVVSVFMGAYGYKNHKMPIAIGMAKYLLWEKLFGDGPMDLKVPDGAPFKGSVGVLSTFVNDNAVSVFYPADPTDCKKHKKWMEYDNGRFISGMAKAVGWMVRIGIPFGLVSSSYHRIMIQAFDSPRINPDLKTAIPLIFSHGCSVSRLFYTTAAILLASYGYIVFLPDHHDGSCSYTQTPLRKEVSFNCGPMDYDHFSIRL